MRHSRMGAGFLLLSTLLVGAAMAADEPQRPRDYTGVWTTYHDNGQKDYQATYIKGVVDGLSYMWNKDGTLIRLGVNKQGKSHGSWMWWHDDGRLWFIRIYEEGQTVREVHYQAGKVVADGQYKDGDPWSGTFRAWYYLNGTEEFYHERREGKPWNGWFWMPRNYDDGPSHTTGKTTMARTLYKEGEFVRRSEEREKDGSKVSP